MLIRTINQDNELREYACQYRWDIGILHMVIWENCSDKRTLEQIPEGKEKSKLFDIWQKNISARRKE